MAQAKPEQKVTGPNLPPMPTPRSAVGLATVEGKIYAIGGTNSWKGGSVDTNEMYDPQTGMWTNKTAMPTKRSYFAIAVYENKIFCMGGLNGNFSNTEASWGEGCAANEVYDPATDTWETKVQLPIARWKLQANVVNGIIYLIGGEPNGTLNQAYDPSSDTWITKTPIQYYNPGQFPPTVTVTTIGASAVVDDKIYWVGNVQTYQSSSTTAVILIYNPQNNSWGKLTSPPSKIIPYLAAATTGTWAPKKIYLFDENALTAIYNPASDSWMYKRHLAKNREDFGVVIADDKLYVIGGGFLRYSIIGMMMGRLYIVPVEDNEQYTPEGYGTVPPTISVTPQHNSTFTPKEKLVFEVNKPVTTMSYSLDGQANVTFTGTLTLTETTNGAHNITAYASDKYGNVGASETVYFTVKQENEPFIWLIVVAVAVACCLAVLIVHQRRKTN